MFIFSFLTSPYEFVPQMKQNIKADNHLTTHQYQSSENPDRPPRSTLAMLRDVPHFFLGRLDGHQDISVHVLFPHLSITQRDFVCMLHEQLTRWVDRVFLPAVRMFFPPHYTQHLPGSFARGLANVRAHQVEGRQVQTASYKAQQAVGYHLQSEHLDDIWREIVRTVETQPGLQDFRDLQLFFSAKGTKLVFKTRPSRPTLPDAMEFFADFFESVVNTDHVQLDRFYVDVGKETCPVGSDLTHQAPEVSTQAQVYCHKRCCLESYMSWMYDGQPPAIGKGQEYFGQNLLQDACSLTSVSPKRSQQHQGGLIYTQMYQSVKEVTDATKLFPFANEALEEMALDPQIRRGASQAAGGRRRDVEVVERAYLASKHRVWNALAASRGKSFGIREEHRITWELFVALLDRLRNSSRDQLEVGTATCPTHAWAIPTANYLDFLSRNADKFATGFEIIHARCNRELVTWGADENDGDVLAMPAICIWRSSAPPRVSVVVELTRTAGGQPCSTTRVVWAGLSEHTASPWLLLD